MDVPPVFALDEARFLPVDLDGLTAVYHRRSGATHLVLEDVRAILSMLEEGACDLAALAERLSSRFDLPDQDEHGLTQALAARIAELEVLGLVRQVEAAGSGTHAG